MTSRRDDPTPVRCPNCGWEGRLMDCAHVYHVVSRAPDHPLYGDVDPVDLCPRCKREEPDTIEKQFSNWLDHTIPLVPF